MIESTKICKVWTQVALNGSANNNSKGERENKYVVFEDLKLDVVYIKYPLDDDYIHMTLSLGIGISKISYN